MINLFNFYKQATYSFRYLHNKDKKSVNEHWSELSLADSMAFCSWWGQLLDWIDLTLEPSRLSWSVISDLWLSSGDRLLAEVKCLES